MDALLLIVSRHGYVLVFAIVLAEAMGLPAPAAMAIAASGAAVASRVLSPVIVLPLAMVALLIGDSVLYMVGRSTGWAMLGFLCRLSLNPETCILRSAESFYKRGKATLVVAKFIPGVNSMAAPLAGSMRMRFSQFLRLDFLGALLYVNAYFALGFLFRDFLAVLLRSFQLASRAFEIGLLLALAVYLVYRARLYRKHLVYRIVPRVQVEELAKLLASEEKQNTMVVDVRSHGYYDAGAVRIKGSLRFEPNHLSEELKTLPKDKNIYLYCT